MINGSFVGGEMDFAKICASEIFFSTKLKKIIIHYFDIFSFIVLQIYLISLLINLINVYCCTYIMSSSSGTGTVPTSTTSIKTSTTTPSSSSSGATSTKPTSVISSAANNTSSSVPIKRHPPTESTSATDEVDYEQNDEEEYNEDGQGNDDGYGDDDDLDALQAQLDEAEATNEAIENQISTTAKSAEEIQKERQKLEEERKERDERSIFISGLDWNLTAKEISDFFSHCGSVARVTIKQDQYGQSKGMSYVEFETKDAADMSLILDGTEFKGRKLHIVRKRTNVPAFQLRGGRGGRGGAGGRGGRGGRGRGGRGGGANPATFYSMMMPAFMAGMGRGGMFMMAPPRGPWRGGPRGGRGGPPRGGGRGGFHGSE